MKYITTLVNLEQLNNSSSFYVAGNKKYSLKLPAYFDVNIVEKYENLYISVNKIFHNDELIDLENYLKYLKNKKIRGIFFSDFAVFSICARLNMLDLLIYDPNTLITNYKELEFFEGKIKGVVISPFISLEELKEFKSDKLELFFLGNGRINLFYSKRKLIGNYCKYHEIDDSFKTNDLLLKEELRPDCYYPIIEDENGTFVYSPYIYSCLDLANELSNIDYLLIDLVYDKKFIKGDNLGFLNRNIVYRKGDLK
ncbi:MAG: U32 family peptidase [bacterium]|nr:U32 family peptidase [bacterium]